MRWWKKLLLGSCVLAILGALGLYLYMQGLGDLRTAEVKRVGNSSAAQKKGRVLLRRSIEKMGGVKRWRALQKEAIEVTFQHDWYHPILRTFFMPLEFSGQKLGMLLRPGSDSVRLTFLDGKRKGKVWGIHRGKTYRATPGGRISWVDDRNIRFHLPSYRYFVFMPFYLHDAELVTYAGVGRIHGHEYHLVYATWGEWGPHRKADQYLLWINQRSMLVDFVQSTVRAMFSRSIVVLSLGEYRRALGLRLPHRLKVLQDMKVIDRGMHCVRLLQMKDVKPAVSRLLVPERKLR